MPISSARRRALAAAMVGVTTLFGAAAARANCNLIPASQREFRSTAGTVDRTIVAPGSRIAVRTDLACRPTAEGFASDPAQSRIFVRFVPPGSDANPALVTELEIPTASITPANCAIAGRCDTLLFFFPDAATLDAALLPDGDERGPTGPVRIRVENLAASVLAEIGPLFEPTLACDDQQPESVFGHLTALPVPNSFSAIASASDTTVEATVDGNGNLLIPVDYSSLLPSGPGSAVFRILEAGAAFDAFASNPGVPITIPDSRRLRSFNLAGRPIPPVLETNAAGDTVLGSVDAQLSVLRIARLDPDAPSPPLYDATDRLFAQKGPILITGATADSRESAPLSTLSADPAGITFASSEGADGDLNLDGDAADRVPQLIDVASGAGTNTGHAVAEVTIPGFARPVLQSGDGYVAYGLSEARQGYIDGDGDGDAMDSLLRVRTVAGSAIVADQSIDASPVVNGKPLAISSGLVFHRTSEADAGARSTALITPTVLDPTQQRGDSTSPSLSGDGRFVAFESPGGATFTTVALPHDGYSHVFVYDRVNGTYEVIDRTPGGVKGDNDANAPSISRDGRWVAYDSQAANLPGADADGFLSDVFLYDRQTQETVCVSCGQAIAVEARNADLSPDATHVAYAYADGIWIWERASATTSNLLAEFPPFSPDADFVVEGITPSISDGGRYVVERFTLRLNLGGMVLTDQVIRFDRQTLTTAFIAPGDLAEISADGRVVAFQSTTDLVTDDTNGASDAYVWDERQGIEIVSVNTEGQTGAGGLTIRASAVSDDGRFVAFVDDSGTEVPGTTGRQTFRYDRVTNVVELVSVANGGAQSDGFSNTIAISGDGHTVAFAGFSTNLDPALFTDIQNVFVRASAGASLNAADADGRDTVVQVFDPATESHRANLRVPASLLAVAAGRAAILSSEAEDGGLDRNGDGDAADAVARIVDGIADAVVETGLAASAVAISDTVACIAVNEAAHGASDLNGDGDDDDDVLFVRVLGTGVQTDTDAAVDPTLLAATGSRCVFGSSERSEAGSPDLNGDGDDEDLVLRVYDAQTAIVTTHPYAVSDLVAKDDVVAFRVCENAQGGADLNFDGDNGGDLDECIMHVLLLATGEVQNTERAAVPCDLAGCDPFFEPYRVSPRSVSFLTSEFIQSGLGVPVGTPLAVDCKSTQLPGQCDLSGDADADDAMIAVYGLQSETAQLIPIAPLFSPSQTAVSPFPTEIGDSGVLYVQVLETQIGEDVNGDGVIDNRPVLVLVGDADGDGTLDDSVNRNDTCVEVDNPQQTDADGDRLGDGACDPAPTSVLPGDVVCDVDRNGQIDGRDVNVVFGDRGAAARPSDPRDPDGDGTITVLDASACRARCTYGACRQTQPANACGFGAEIALALAGLAALRRRIRS